jgi:hypothetical protein
MTTFSNLTQRAGDLVLVGLLAGLPLAVAGFLTHAF